MSTKPDFEFEGVMVDHRTSDTVWDRQGKFVWAGVGLTFLSTPSPARATSRVATSVEAGIERIIEAATPCLRALRLITESYL